MARSLILLAILGTLASCGSSSAASSTSAATAAAARCGPAGAQTLSHSSQGRVYVHHNTVYGCASGGTRPVVLGSAGLCPGSTDHVGPPVAVAGKVAAYAARTCGVDTSSARVIVRRLSDGRKLSASDATKVSPGPESFATVGSIVVRRSGAVAWIGTASSIATHGSYTQVLELSGGLLHVLDQGSEIQTASLTLRGSKLSWEHGGAQRSASLR